MSMDRKINNPGFLCLLSIFMIYPLPQMAIDIYLPSWPSMVKYFHTTDIAMQFSLIVYLFFLGIAQVIYGVLSEKYGRKTILLLGITIFFISSFICAFATSIDELIFLRILQGLGIGCGFTIASAMLSDIFEGKKLAKISSYSAIVYSLSLIFAPAIGGYIQQYLGWQANFLSLAIYSALLILAIAIFVPETKSLNSRLRISYDLVERTYLKLFSNFSFSSSVLCLILAYGVMVSFNTVAPFLLQIQMHMSPAEYGKYLLFIGASYSIGSLLNSYTLKFFSLRTAINFGFMIMFVSSFGLLFINYHEIINATGLVLIISMAFFSVGFIYPNCFANALDCFSEKGFASAFIGCAILIGVSISTMFAFYFNDFPERYLAAVLLISSMLGIILIAFQIVPASEESNANT